MSDKSSKQSSKHEKVEYPAWMCVECGHVYDPGAGDPYWEIRAGVPFEQLPEDWFCPVCSAGKEKFRLFSSQL